MPALHLDAIQNNFDLLSVRLEKIFKHFGGVNAFKKIKNLRDFMLRPVSKNCHL